MTVSNLIFFIISTVLVLGFFFLPVCSMFYSYCLNVKKGHIMKWSYYIGDGLLLFFIGEVLSSFLILILALITGIDGHFISCFGIYIKSDLFKFILSLFIILSFMFCYYFFIIANTLDFLKLKKIYINLKGLENAKIKLKQSLADIDDDINNIDDPKVKEEYEKNKQYLLYEFQNYEIKINELQKLQIKIVLKLKEKGYSKINYD